jgi:hypothetical protein
MAKGFGMAEERKTGGGRKETTSIKVRVRPRLRVRLRVRFEYKG